MDYSHSSMSEEDNNFDDDFDDEEFDEEGEDEFGDEEAGAKLYPIPRFPQTCSCTPNLRSPFFNCIYVDQSLCINDCLGMKHQEWVCGGILSDPHIPPMPNAHLIAV